MFEILKSFSLDTAVKKNASFRFFVTRYLAGNEALEYLFP